MVDILKEEIEFDHQKFGDFDLSQNITMFRKNTELTDDFVFINTERIQPKQSEVKLTITVSNSQKKDLYKFFSDLKFRSFDCNIKRLNLDKVNLSIVSDLEYNTQPNLFSISFVGTINYVY